MSIVIPTCNRPQFLRSCLESAIAQSYRPLEVVVTDDSSDDASERMLASLTVPDSVDIIYRRNTPSLWQAANVNQGFRLASGRRIVLIHDDDVLLRGSVSALAAAMDDQPEAVIAYGRQRLMSPDGTDRGDAQADWVARRYGTVACNAGLQPDALASALWRQVPNNGYMVHAAAAKAVGYRPESEVGHVCDFDFGVRLAQRHSGRSFLLIDRETSAYRLTPASVSRGSAGGGSSFGYRICDALAVDPGSAAASARQAALRSFAPGAVRELITVGNLSAARGVYYGPHYPKRWTPRGLFHRALIHVPHLDGIVAGPLRRLYKPVRRRLNRPLRRLAIMLRQSSAIGNVF
ncbi:MAG: glycosyltransferase family 2 protein [Planctomycetota bacterium]